MNVEVKALLRSSVKGSVIPGKVIEKNGDLSELEFTLMVRGRHTLQVTIDRLSILYKSVDVFAAIPPIQLGDPVRTIYTIEEPRGIVISSNGKILISTHTAVVAVSEDGNTVHDIARSAEFDLFGIAVDQDDNIYVADSARG